MLDLSPEKIMALLAVGMVVLGPHRLPAAARSLAHGLANARRLAASLTEPVHTSLSEPRQHLERAVAEVRGAVRAPAQAAAAKSGAFQPSPVEDPFSRLGEAGADPAGRFDPSDN